ncbi:DnaJ-domain-containing protein [Hesseltinella vesiculosa]|uniref:DnaJ-domain-containing protein n=1 Tax=Hesseltinella vesiculosa TaxID=101127 RepID=A0A1X2G5Z2_9FUNG|nr:DnaJ-domain-containing protein [Hesseltinella vesiculosa]
MPALELPKGSTLYNILHLDKESADQSKIKKAYRKLALKFHPDKQSNDATDKEKEHATHQFQLIGLAYTILRDPGKKKVYDRTGSLVAENWMQEDKDWNDYFKELWTGVVNAETIEAQAKKYKGSDEEAQDVLKYYKECKGDMDQMLLFVELSSASDVPRYIKIVQQAIKDKTVANLPAFDKTTTASAQARRLKAEEKRIKEFDQQESAKAKGKKNDKDDEESSLQALILNRAQHRQARFDQVVDNLIAKATPKAKKKKSTAAKRSSQHITDEPSEEEFQKARKRLNTKSKV